MGSRESLVGWMRADRRAVFVCTTTSPDVILVVVSHIELILVDTVTFAQITFVKISSSHGIYGVGSTSGKNTQPNCNIGGIRARYRSYKCMGSDNRRLRVDLDDSRCNSTGRYYWTVEHSN